MKIILRKIEPYENAKFSQTLKRHIDYTRVLLEITKKILYNGDSIDKVSLSSQAYLKLIIDKQSRILYIYQQTSFILLNIHVKWRLINIQI